MLVAVFPACMYVFSVFMMVHFVTKIYNIKGGKKEKSSIDIFKAERY